MRGTSTWKDGGYSLMNRRGFMKMAGVAATYAAVRVGEYAATETFTRAVVDPALADRSTGPHFATRSNRPVANMAPDSAARIAAEAWAENASVDHVIHALWKVGQDGRYTIACPDSMGRLCVTRQGAGSRRLWDYSVEGIPMGARPDNPALGKFLLERYQRVSSGGPILENVVLFPGRVDLPGKFRYVGFAATDGVQIIAVTEPSDPAPIAAGGHDPERQAPSIRRMIDRQRANPLHGISV